MKRNPSIWPSSAYPNFPNPYDSLERMELRMPEKAEYEKPEAGSSVASVGSGMIMESEIKISTKVSVYMDDGRVFEYFVSDPVKAREHVAKIIATGYRSTPMNTNDLEWYPPHRIDKVKIAGGGESTKYRDVVRST